ncbi:PPOX class F420-dependent oxidoreductase [Kitasatospora sp. NBC_01266]|uniref:PPOX class F420-dependent oxidoreductase n=1 Tax=Kitasatospora sp. NBC_01266 TaxID=2903572 RepID=UPI002E34EB98|nr:PPOX class F420-dependent oxidoreductase [Kitasatospora sp. NBC_01266]
MSVELSEGLKKYLDNQHAFATVATIQPDGRPHLSITWVLRDGDDLLISTTVGRRKEQNLRRDSRITIMINPPEEPYSYAEIRGTATLTAEGADELIHTIARKYTGADYPDADGERVIIRVSADRIVGSL